MNASSDSGSNSASTSAGRSGADSVSKSSADPAIKRADSGRPDIRLVIADVDGTLVTKDKILTDRAREAVRKLRAAGIAFAITSGRPPRGMEMLVEPLSLTEPIAGFNGGIFAHPDMSVIDQRVLPADVTPQVIETIRAHKLDVWIYRGNDWYTP